MQGGACRMFINISLIHSALSLLTQLKHFLGLADQHAHASTFECVRLCSEGKIKFTFCKEFDLTRNFEPGGKQKNIV